MPTVGKKKFAYTKKGKAAAKKYAKAKGKKVKTKKGGYQSQQSKDGLQQGQTFYKTRQKENG